VDALALVDAIPGWMLPEDAEKLYELAQAADGPVLEIGTYRGRSAVLMALAMRDAGQKAPLYSIDVDRTAQHAAAVAARARGLTDRIVLIRGTLAAFARAYPQLRPALTFVDGDHTEAGVERDLAVLETLVPAGGCLLFHDFTDPRNDDPQCDEIAVRPTVLRSWVAEQCEFNGEFGCCGLFTRVAAPPDAGVATADLLGLASRRDQYLYRVRNPAGRAWRRIRKQEWRSRSSASSYTDHQNQIFETTGSTKQRGFADADPAPGRFSFGAAVLKSSRAKLVAPEVG